MQTHQFDRAIRLYNLGDVHYGSHLCDEPLLKKLINTIAADDSAYWVSTGDLLDAALKNSKSSVYESCSPEEELDGLTSLLQPIQSKCLGFVASNHHNRVQREVGISLDRVLADRSGLPFLGISAIIKITCGRCSYFISLHHGVGGGSSGNKLNRAMTLAQNWLGADVYFTGHTHSFSYAQDIQTIIDRKRDKTTEITTHHVTTGHYIKYPGSYAEDLGLKAKPRGSAFAGLTANGSGQELNKAVAVGFWCG
jgi:hypothetical protein